MLEPITGDGYTDGRTDPDRLWGAVDMDMRTEPECDGELELDSLDFLAFVEMVREPPTPNGTADT